MPEPAPQLLSLPEPETPAVYRHGLGYRGVWREAGIVLELEQVHAAHGDLTGLLRVRYSVATPFVAKFNVAALSTRTQVAKHLTSLTGFATWPALLDRFCVCVLDLAGQGPAAETIGGDEPQPAALEYVLAPVVPEGTPAMIYGAPGAGKSTLATAIGFSVQSGCSVLEGWIPRQRNVLVLDWEAGRSEWHQRLCRLARGTGEAVPLIQYRRPRGPLAGQVEALAREVADHQIGLVIVDSMMPALGSAREGGDASETSSRFFEALAELGCTALLIGQVTGESVENGKPSKPYGSVNQMYETRSLWELRVEPEPEYPEAQIVVLSHRKVNQGPRLAPQALRVIHGAQTILLERCELPEGLEGYAGSTSERLRQLLARSGALTRREVIEELGISRARLRVTLHRSPLFSKLAGDRVGLA